MIGELVLIAAALVGVGVCVYLTLRKPKQPPRG
ncbi:DUF4366 domain-containing protein [Amycolatopsis lurida]|nr:DUF4366 domain-containing protein [Amycolatopsis lurida]